MTRTQGLCAVLSGVLILAWLSTGSRVAAPRGAAASPRPPALAPDPAIEQVSRQAARLRELLAAAPRQGPSHRNPFQFRDVAPSASSRSPRSAQGRHFAPSGAPLEASRPDMRLLGVAEDTVAGVPVRTAILSAAGELCLVREGERLLGRYEVMRIAADAVQLKDGGRLFTLALR